MAVREQVLPRTFMVERYGSWRFRCYANASRPGGKYLALEADGIDDASELSARFVAFLRSEMGVDLVDGGLVGLLLETEAKAKLGPESAVMVDVDELERAWAA